MRRTRLSTAGVIVFTFLTACSADAQQVVNLWLGAAPGSEGWTQKERTIADRLITRVTGARGRLWRSASGRVASIRERVA
jgi:hypothetical protein